jgi:hypothetical protein
MKKYEKAGAPTKYRPEYCEMILEYFNVDPLQEETVTIITPYGNNKIEKKRIACELPTIEGFCWKIGICKQTLYTWAAEHKEFMDSYLRAHERQEQIIKVCTTAGFYPANFSALLLNIDHNRIPKTHSELSGPGGESLNSAPVIINIIPFGSDEQDS